MNFKTKKRAYLAFCPKKHCFCKVFYNFCAAKNALYKGDLRVKHKNIKILPTFIKNKNKYIESYKKIFVLLCFEQNSVIFCYFTQGG